MQNTLTTTIQEKQPDVTTINKISRVGPIGKTLRIQGDFETLEAAIKAKATRQYFEVSCTSRNHINKVIYTRWLFAKQKDCEKAHETLRTLYDKRMMAKNNYTPDTGEGNESA